MSEPIKVELSHPKKTLRERRFVCDSAVLFSPAVPSTEVRLSRFEDVADLLPPEPRLSFASSSSGYHMNHKNHKLASLLENVFKRLHRKSKGDKQTDRLYQTKDYLNAYSQHTDIRVERDPHAAVGGMWEEIGKLQFDFIVNRGLQSHHRLLDIGCGTLRGGRHFIKHLNSGNYSGIDISSKAIEYAMQLVEQEGLSKKQPRLLVGRDLRFREFDGEVFDYLLAQSVFTHLKHEHIRECFQSISRIMNHDSVFFFTFAEAVEFKQTGLKDFHYPFSFFQSLADEFRFNLKNCSKDYEHPRGQHMAMLSKLEGPT